MRKQLMLFAFLIGISFLPCISNAQVVELTEKQLFERVATGYEAYENDYNDYQGDKPCVLLFHNGTCPYSKQIGRFLEEFSKKYKGQIYFYTVNVWKISDETIEDFDIQGIPMTYFFKSGKQRIHFLGMLYKSDIEEEIEWLLDEN